MPIKASVFQMLNYNENLVERNGKKIVELKSNAGDGTYSYKEKNFEFPYAAITGVIDGGKHYLLASLDIAPVKNAGLLEFKIWGEKTDGKSTIDAKAVAAAELEWHKDGAIAVILVDDIPMLAAVARVLASNKIIAKNKMIIDLKVNEADVKIAEESLEAFLMSVVAEGLPKKDSEMFKIFQKCKEYGIGLLPYMSREELPQTVIRDDFDQPIGNVPLCFPFTGDLPTYDSVEFTSPTIKPRNGNGSGSGGSTTVTVTSYCPPEEKLKFICAQMKIIYPDLNIESVNDIAQLLHDYPESVVGYNLALQLTSVSPEKVWHSNMPPEVPPEKASKKA